MFIARKDEVKILQTPWRLEYNFIRPSVPYPQWELRQAHKHLFGWHYVITLKKLTVNHK